MLAAGTAHVYIYAPMTAAAILAVWIVWYLAHQAWETFLTVLNLRHSARHPQPPPELNGVLDQPTVTRSRAYLAARSRLNLLSRGLRAAVALVVVATGALGALDQWLLRNVTTTQHISGTCKMGPDSDPMAVLDQYCRVRGIEGLRVVDVSTLPDCVRANTNATTIMIAERVADWMK